MDHKEFIEKVQNVKLHLERELRKNNFEYNEDYKQEELLLLLAIRNYLEKWMAGGRPLKYNSVEEMEIAIDEYFAKAEIVTITGLALHLGFNSRQSLINYQEKNEFLDTIKKAKARVEMAYEERLIMRGNGGDIFALKNFGWQDKQEIESKNENNNKLTIEVKSQEDVEEITKELDKL